MSLWLQLRSTISRSTACGLLLVVAASLGCHAPRAARTAAPARLGYNAGYCETHWSSMETLVWEVADYPLGGPGVEYLPTPPIDAEDVDPERAEQLRLPPQVISRDPHPVQPAGYAADSGKRPDVVVVKRPGAAPPLSDELDYFRP